MVQSNPTVGYPRVKYRKITIPRAQVLTLNATPVALTPDPGDGFADVLHMIVINKAAGTTEYASNTGELQVRYRGQATGIVAQIDASDLDATTERTYYVGARAPNTGSGNQGVWEDRGLELFKATDEYTAGTDAQVVTVHVYYQTLKLR